jgi:hypothetical protein
MMPAVINLKMLTVHPTPHLFPLNNSAKYKASKLPATKLRHGLYIYNNIA